MLSTPIATGGMSTVWHGTDEVLDRDVAVKILSPFAGKDQSLRERFREEAMTVARLNHPNIVAVFDAGEQDDVPFIVMERLPGATFADELSGGPVPPARARRVGADVLSALECAHAVGVIHRDVKPHNVLIASDGSAKLSDFGIAKTVSADATRTSNVYGTPAYLAPELVEGTAASARSDIYGVGVMLYEAVTAAKPFRGDTPWGVVAAAREGRFTPLQGAAPWVDPALRDVIERAIDADPVRRFATAAQMRSRLLDQVPSQPEPTLVLPILDDTQVIERPAPAVSRKPTLWAALFLAALMLGAIAFAGSKDGGPVRPPAASLSPAATDSPRQPSVVAPVQPEEFEDPPEEHDEEEGRGRGGKGKKGNDERD